METQPKFKVGDKVCKPVGYAFDGTVLAVFQNAKKQWRVVAEIDSGGMLQS